MQTTILGEESAKARAAHIEKFVEVGEHCVALRNFAGAMQILGGPNSTPISRLKKTWARVRGPATAGLGTITGSYLASLFVFFWGGGVCCCR